MTINSKLQNFSQQELVLSHNDTERNRILASLSQLEKVLKDKLQGNISEFLRFGSFTRNTILPRKYDRLSDIDLMVIFNSAYGIKTADTYRKYLLDVVSNAYPYSVSKKDFPVVKLELNHIVFDIVPAYTTKDWFKSTIYYIPNNNNGWRSTVPNDLNNDLANKNQNVGNNIVRNIVRLCKHWNAGANYPFESYLMEKEILNVTFWGGDDTYSGFLKVMNSIAGDRAGVRQALDYIHQYKGNGNSIPNEQRQFEWLKRLLPGLT